MINRLEHLSYNKRLRELALLALRRDSYEGTSSMYVSFRREGVKSMNPGSSQWWWAIGQVAMGRNCCTGSSTRIRVEQFSVNDHALEQIPQRGFGLSLIGDIQEVSGQNSVLCALGWSCLNREVGPDDSKII